MKKNGFTLIELIISIMLVGVVMVSMIGTLLSLKDTYNNMSENTEASVYSSLITKVLNEHFNKNNGIKSVTCDTTTHCSIVLGNNKNMVLEIINANTNTTTSTDTTGGRITTTEEATTLKYSGSNYTYLKTIKHFKRKYLVNNREVESGYKFTGIESHQYQYTNVADSSLKDVITKITIKMNDEKYNIDLYASSTINTSGESSRVTITAYASNTTIPATSGWTISEDGYTATKRVTVGSAIGALPILTKPRFVFGGWSSDLEGNNIVTSSTVATADMTIYPKWTFNSGSGSYPGCYWTYSPELILICPGGNSEI